MNPPQRGNARGRARWSPYNYRRTTTVDRRPKPISVPVTHPNHNTEPTTSGFVSSGNDQSQPYVVRPVAVTGSERYAGWNLYFPEESRFSVFMQN